VVITPPPEGLHTFVIAFGGNALLIVRCLTDKLASITEKLALQNQQPRHEDGATMQPLKLSDVGVGDDEEPRSRSPDAQALRQALLSTLANLDFEYERERERVSSSTTDPILRARALQRLEEMQRARRDPYVRHLTALQSRTAGERDPGAHET
jgi:hypothetical protein